MTIEFPTNAETELRRAELEKAQAILKGMQERHAAHLARAPKIASEISSAMADGDEARIAVLRSERSAAEVEVRDLESATVTASKRIADADTRLAQAEWKLIDAAMCQAVEQYNEVCRNAEALFLAFRDAGPRAMARFASAFMGDDPEAAARRPDHPKNFITKGFKGPSGIIWHALAAHR